MYCLKLYIVCKVFYIGLGTSSLVHASSTRQITTRCLHRSFQIWLGGKLAMRCWWVLVDFAAIDAWKPRVENHKQTNTQRMRTLQWSSISL